MKSIDRSEIRTIEQAIRNKWDIPESAMALVPLKMLQAVAKGNYREAAAAARVLALMVAQNQELDPPKVSLIQHQHLHAVVPIAGESDVDRKRRELVDRARRIRDNS